MDDSHFGRLSGELRNRIYEYALTFDHVNCVRGPLEGRMSGPSLCTQLALTQVCGQVRAETLHLPLTLNDPIIGTAPVPLQYSHFGYVPSPLHYVWKYVDSMAKRRIDIIPPSLRTESTMFTLYMSHWVQDIHIQLLKVSTPQKQFGAPWSLLRLQVGQLLRDLKFRKLVLDFDHCRKDGPYSWCDYEKPNPFKSGQQFPYQMEFELPVDGRDTGETYVVAKYDRVRQLVAKHETHDHKICNFAKHGNRFLKRMQDLDGLAAEFFEPWSSGAANMARKASNIVPHSASDQSEHEGET